MLEASFVILVGAMGLWLSMAQSRGRLQAWREAVASCGLEVVEASAGWTPRLRARAGQVYARIETLGDKGRFARISIEAPAPPDFQSVTIRAQTSLEIGREIEIGDRRFDDAFFIQGPARLVHALLDAEGRRLLINMKDAGVMITGGELQAIATGPQEVADVLSRLLRARKHFAPPIHVLQRLVENAAGDPEPGVRLQNLLLLVRELSWSPETRGALLKACSDPVAEIRLRAARELGAEAHGVLQELAERLEDDDVSAEALLLLDREMPFERLNGILGLALRRRRLRTARVCLASIGRRGAAAGVDLVAKVLEREQGELASAAADALGAIGSPAAEPALIEALQRDDADLRVAAARALGRGGTAAAVPPLMEAAERSGVGRELRRATRQAIAEIHSRLQGASPGQLSLAGAEAGQLSLPEAEAGELSLADDRAGRLSIRDGEDPGAGA
jgi:hypothetical protein